MRWRQVAEVGQLKGLDRIFVLPARRIQSVVATPMDDGCESNRSRVSAGLSQPRVLRGRRFSWADTKSRWSGLWSLRSVPLGKYCLSRPLVFSLEPRCHGLA